MNLRENAEEQLRVHCTTTDKLEQGYLDIYDKLFLPFKDKEEGILELGVWRGESLVLWHDYFSKGEVCGIDKELQHRAVKRLQDLSRVKLIVSSQENISDIVEGLPLFSVIIDDCSHRVDLTVSTFTSLWPKIVPGGIYVIEDTHLTSSHQKFRSLNKKIRAYDFWYDLIETKLNGKDEIAVRNQQEISSIAFYPGLIVITKV
jgi:hypothetical protein